MGIATAANVVLCPRWRTIQRRLWLAVLMAVCGSVGRPLHAAEDQRAPVRDPARQFAKRLESWVEIKQRNIVMQERDYSCGAAVLATVARYYWGDDVGEEDFLDALDELLTAEEAEDRVKNGLTMSDLRRAAVACGYQAVVGKLPLEKLSESKVPLIVGITVDEHDHFVVYRGLYPPYVYLADPIRGNIRVRIPEFSKQWQKNTVLAVHKPGQKVRESSPLGVTAAEVDLGKLNDQLIRTQGTRLWPRLKQHR